MGIKNSWRTYAAGVVSALALVGGVARYTGGNTDPALDGSAQENGPVATLLRVTGNGPSRAEIEMNSPASRQARADDAAMEQYIRQENKDTEAAKSGVDPSTLRTPTREESAYSQQLAKCATDALENTLQSTISQIGAAAAKGEGNDVRPVGSQEILRDPGGPRGNEILMRTSINHSDRTMDIKLKQGDFVPGSAIAAVTAHVSDIAHLDKVTMTDISDSQATADARGATREVAEKTMDGIRACMNESGAEIAQRVKTMGTPVVAVQVRRQSSSDSETHYGQKHSVPAEPSRNPLYNLPPFRFMPHN